MAARKNTTKKTTTRKPTAKPKTARKSAVAKKPAARKPVKAAAKEPAKVEAWREDTYSWKQSMKVYSLTGLDVRENWDNSGMTKGGASDIIQECIADPKKARARLQKLAGVAVKKALPVPLTDEQKLQRQIRRLNRRLKSA